MEEASENLFASWINSIDNIDHVVTGGENAAGARVTRGTRRAICGVEFRPGLMEAPPGWTCQACLKVCQTQARARRVQKLRERKRKQLAARLLRRPS